MQKRQIPAGASSVRKKNLHNYDREKEKKDKICLKSEAVMLKKEGYRVSGAGVGELG